MSAGPETDDSRLDAFNADWRILREQPCNVLLESTAAGTDAVLHLLRRHLREPIVQQGPSAALDLPSNETRAWVLTDPAALSTADQRRLLAWMDRTGSRTQVITIAT